MVCHDDQRLSGIDGAVIVVVRIGLIYPIQQRQNCDPVLSATVTEHHQVGQLVGSNRSSFRLLAIAKLHVPLSKPRDKPKVAQHRIEFLDIHNAISIGVPASSPTTKFGKHRCRSFGPIDQIFPRIKITADRAGHLSLQVTATTGETIHRGIDAIQYHGLFIQIFADRLLPAVHVIEPGGHVLT